MFKVTIEAGYTKVAMLVKDNELVQTMQMLASAYGFRPDSEEIPVKTYVESLGPDEKQELKLEIFDMLKNKETE